MGLVSFIDTIAYYTTLLDSYGYLIPISIFSSFIESGLGTLIYYTFSSTFRLGTAGAPPHRLPIIKNCLIII